MPLATGSPAKERAVVLGSGIGGLLAAAALRRAGLDVIIFERDRLPARPVPRPGIPHGRQLHNLLSRAQLHIEDLLPGFHEKLLAAGGVKAEVSTQTHVHELGVAMPERPLGLRIWSAPQPLIEHVAREFLTTDGTVVCDDTKALGLDIENDQRVRGVQISRRGRVENVPADLVVDAMGAMSPAASWLAKAGCASPKREAYLSRHWYCSLTVRRPPAWVGKPDFWLIFPTYPNTRGGMVSPAGDQEWYVSLSGVAPNRPPRSAADFTALAAELETPVIADLLAEATPASRSRLFGKPTATWRRYDRLGTPITGFLPVGDAVASLNPLLGQGISVAAWQSAQLAYLLESASSLPGITGQYLAATAGACRDAWALTTLFNPPPDSDAPRLDAADWSDVVDAVANDIQAHRRYVSMWHLLEPVTILNDILRSSPKAMT
jgi:2-polyprenyl-6-methoxyphenol hydroxylase-like FAD-dependent oxidoreductase